MMSPQSIPTDPKSILDIVIKRRWFVIVPFFLAMIVGILLALKLPRIYEASTLILIQPQKVPQSYVQPIVSTDPSDRLNTLSQQVLSRTNLERLIKEFKLFQGANAKQMFMEDKLESLRKSISIDVTRDRRENDAFSITFRNREPETAMNVANSLASYFIDENLKSRESQAIGTSEFLDDELNTMKSKLERVESQLKNYRESNMGELPEQLDSNLRMLDRLQQHLNESQQRFSETKIKLAALQNQSEALMQQPATVNGDQSTNLDQLNAQLKNLLARYTDEHPDVIRLKARIAELKKHPQNQQTTDQSPQKEGSDSEQKLSSLSPAMQAQNLEIQQELRRLELDITDINKKIAYYQLRVENTPKREQELLSLKRDYDNIQKTYDSLLARKLEAEIAVNMERKQKGEQFKIVDPAQLPQKPVQPNMKSLFVKVVGVGLAIGGAIIFLLEYLDESIKSPEVIETALKLKVLCTVPQIISGKMRTWRIVEHVFCGIMLLLSLTLFAGFTALSIMS